MLLDFLQKDVEAEAALGKALAIAPDNADYLTALAQFYLKRGRLREAQPLAERLIQSHPNHPAAARRKAFIEQEQAKQTESLKLIENCAMFQRLWIGAVVSLMVTLSPGVETARAQTADRAAKHSNWTQALAHTVLRMHNPQYNGKGQFQIEGGKVLAAGLAGTDILDLTPLGQMDLIALDLRGLPVGNIDALQGLPLRELYLEDTTVKDLTPLKGMPLIRLYLSNTPVQDLTPLKGLPITALNLLGTPVADLSPLSKMPLQFLWLNETPVTDITPLAGCPLVSLTLHQTAVSDLVPLAGSRLERLHIGETPVTDLMPLSNVPLKRLIFTPANITQGIDLMRTKQSLNEIGPSFENRMSPTQFWKLFDQGAFQTANKNGVTHE